MKEIQYVWVLSIVLWIYSTAIDGGEAKQQRRFCTAKTRVQKLTRRSILNLPRSDADVLRINLCAATKRVSPCQRF